jgi:hypothetical protein
MMPATVPTGSMLTMRPPAPYRAASRMALVISTVRTLMVVTRARRSITFSF